MRVDHVPPVTPRDRMLVEWVAQAKVGDSLPVADRHVMLSLSSRCGLRPAGARRRHRCSAGVVDEGEGRERYSEDERGAERDVAVLVAPGSGDVDQQRERGRSRGCDREAFPEWP